MLQDMERLVSLGIAITLLTAACGSDASSSTTPPASSTTVTNTDAPTTSTTPATTSTAPSTSTTTTAPATTTTVEGCASSGDTLRKESADPLAMSVLLGADIRVGAHPCFDRVVIELGGDGTFPGWWVEYVQDPVTLGESNETAFIAGEATIEVRMGMWMQTMEGAGYTGPTDIFPTTVEHIEEMRLTEDWEGVTRWAIGVDEARPFTVTVLQGPPRLVIDVLTAG